MNTSKILVAALIGAVVAFFLGWIIWGNLLAGTMSDHAGSATGVMRGPEEMLWVPMIIGHLALGLLLALIFGRWASISTFATGLKAGAVLGLLIALSWDMIMLGTSHIMSPTGVAIDILATAVSMGITGGAGGWWLGRD